MNQIHLEHKYPCRKHEGRPKNHHQIRKIIEFPYAPKYGPDMFIHKHEEKLFKHARKHVFKHQNTRIQD